MDEDNESGREATLASGIDGSITLVKGVISESQAEYAGRTGCSQGGLAGLGLEWKPEEEGKEERKRWPL
jgi:hypothetical protein